MVFAEPLMQQMFAEVETMARKDEQWAPGGRVMNHVFCEGLEQLPHQGAAVRGKLQGNNSRSISALHRVKCKGGLLTF